MIEAVNSVVSNAQVLRGSAEQVSSVETPAVAQSSESRESAVSAPQAPYISPYIAIDNSSNEAVILVRDSDTGDTVVQYPSESALKARQSADEIAAQAESNATVRESNGGFESFESSDASVSVDAGQAQQAATALSTAAAAQTSQIAQATVSVSA